MDSEIIAALIGGGATLLAALLAIFGTTISSALKRKSLGYPSIKGCWKATWYIDGIDEIYLEDIVMIKKIRGMKIYVMTPFKLSQQTFNFSFSDFSNASDA